MSSRRLGGGRILGSGKGLSANPASSASMSSARRASSPLAISESNFSQTSTSSLSPPQSGSFSDLGQDIGSSISVGAQKKSSDASASALVCPICNEGMVTLLQLNRHIDDSHQELAAEEQNEVKTWFDKQVLKAKRFQPLSLINMKLRGLDVFESNESNPSAPFHSPPPPLPTTTTTTTSAIANTIASVAAAEIPIDPDELITRNHWQRPSPYDVCTDPACGRGLGPINGNINCRKCGRLFCEEHTMYQMKLSRSANHEPVRGYWARVCETCYKSREGYNDHAGTLVDHTASFVEARRRRVERQNLEVARLEKRLTKLTRLLVATMSSSSSVPVALQKNNNSARKAIEQSVVTWEEDDKVPQCPFCRQEFGSWTFRRHHCRVCGRVVCGDPQTACSSEVSLNVALAHGGSSTTETTEKPLATTTNGGTGGTSPLDVRMCRDCNHTIFSGRDFAASLLHKPPDQRAYETLCQFERGIRQLLPSFHRSLQLLTLRPGDLTPATPATPPATHAQIQEAAKIRKRLIDGFTKYGSAARRMRDLSAPESPTQQRLQAAVYAYATNFLHVNMLPLKSVPHMLRRRSAPSTPSSSSPSSPSPMVAGAASSASARLHNGQQQQQFTSSLRHSELAESEHSEASTAVSQLETEEKDLRERLAVLEEQRFMVQGMARTATAARRFEEVSALTRNADELDGEIGELKRRIGEVEQRWEGVYGT